MKAYQKCAGISSHCIRGHSCVGRVKIYAISVIVLLFYPCCMLADDITQMWHKFYPSPVTYDICMSMSPSRDKTSIILAGHSIDVNNSGRQSATLRVWQIDLSGEMEWETYIAEGNMHDAFNDRSSAVRYVAAVDAEINMFVVSDNMRRSWVVRLTHDGDHIDTYDTGIFWRDMYVAGHDSTSNMVVSGIDHKGAVRVAGIDSLGNVDYVKSITYEGREFDAIESAVIGANNRQLWLVGHLGHKGDRFGIPHKNVVVSYDMLSGVTQEIEMTGGRGRISRYSDDEYALVYLKPDTNGDQKDIHGPYSIQMVIMRTPADATHVVELGKYNFPLPVEPMAAWACNERVVSVYGEGPVGPKIVEYDRTSARIRDGLLKYSIGLADEVLMVSVYAGLIIEGKQFILANIIAYDSHADRDIRLPLIVTLDNCASIAQ